MSNNTTKRLDEIPVEIVETDILIIGGGNAGCYAAIEAKSLNPSLKVTIMEKAHMSRSGALAAGMDAINTYIPTHKGETKENLVKWMREQVGGGPLRDDLALSIAEILNESVEMLEEWGLPIVKDEEGHYKHRGRWDIAIFGEQLKPIIAEKTLEKGVQVFNRVVATNFLMDGNKCIGAMGFGVRDGKFYIFQAKATIVSTGGACGLYKAVATDYSGGHHQTWMCPFNVGTGYAMGIRIGAEMSSFEQRWVALRTKDFSGPIDTISVGYKCPMINAKGDRIMEIKFADKGADKAGRFLRLTGAMSEWLEGSAPTYVDTTHLTYEQAKKLKQDLLNERPSFVLFLASRGMDITKEPIEVYGSDPYIVGGHTGSGYWVDINRMTTIPGLFAAGEAAAGVPNKFVGGCAAEGRIAARGAIEYIKSVILPPLDIEQVEREKRRVFAPLLKGTDFDGITATEMEERLQRLMDEYAGGISQFYKMNEERLDYTIRHIKMLKNQVEFLYATDLHDLMGVHEVIDRLDVAEVVAHHLKFRKETRWPGWQTRIDYPNLDPKLDCFIESVRDPETLEVKMFTRPDVKII